MNINQLVALTDDLCLQMARGCTSAEIVDNCSIVLGTNFGISFAEVESLDRNSFLSSKDMNRVRQWRTVSRCGVKLYSILRRLVSEKKDIVLVRWIALFLIWLRLFCAGVTKAPPTGGSMYRYCTIKFGR